ncbi:MAG: bifunctional oligoribonuclease/PAP phosphatase NrnA [Planctomycetota bacterium]
MNTLPLAKLAKSSDGAQTDVLRDLLRTRQRLLVLSHNNPDPDSLGGAVGLQEFARLAAGVDSTLAITGKILRAENQAMVRELGIQMERLDTVKLSDFDCVALVDTQPGFGHTFVPAGTDVDIVIDHHVCDDAAINPDVTAFVDVRPEIGATSSIVASHLLNAGVTPSPEAATALAYGIRTDTADLSRNVSELDVQVSEYLSDHIDRQRLAAIVNPRLPVAYYRTLRDALGKVRLYDGLSLCSLGSTISAEMVAEVADLLLRMEGVEAVFCGGLVGQSYYVSVRTQPGGDAWQLIKASMEGENGSCGGHGSVAGGSITLECADARQLRRLERRLERNILQAMGATGSAAKLGDDD